MIRIFFYLIILLSSNICHAQPFSDFGANRAYQVFTGITDFDNILTSSDVTVQKALETLDHPAASQVSVDVTNFDRLLSASDTTVKFALETLDESIVSSSIGELSDVAITSADTDDFLKYNGSSWVDFDLYSGTQTWDGVNTYVSGGLHVREGGGSPTNFFSFIGSVLSANVNATLPSLSSSDTFAFISHGTSGTPQDWIGVNSHAGGDGTGSYFASDAFHLGTPVIEGNVSINRSDGQASDVVVEFPQMNTNDVIATLGVNQTFTGNQNYSGTLDINSTATFQDNVLRIENPAVSQTYTLVGQAISTSVNLNLPLTTASSDTLPALGISQTFTGVNTFSSSNDPGSIFNYTAADNDWTVIQVQDQGVNTITLGDAAGIPAFVGDLNSIAFGQANLLAYIWTVGNSISYVGTNHAFTGTGSMTGLFTANGGIDMNGNDIIIDANANSRWENGVDDETELFLGGSSQVKFTNGTFEPSNDNDIDLGTSSLRFKDSFFNGLIYRSTQSGITASTTQTQGQQPLTEDINEVSTVANAGDVVTLPSAAAGIKIVIIHNGANSMDVFPATGDNIDGSGVNTAVSQATGTVASYYAYDSTNWSKLEG